MTGVLARLVRPLLLSILVFWTGAATAHEIRPAVADVAVGQSDLRLRIRMPLEQLAAGLDLAGISDTNDAAGAALYDRLRAMDSGAFETAFREAWPRISQGFIIESGGTRVAPEIAAIAVPAVGDVELPRDSVLTLTADLPEGDDPVQIGWRPNYGELVLRQEGGGEDAYEAFLMGGELSEPLPRGAVSTESGLKVFLRYIGVGFEHIVPLGVDHILFVLGLFFFSTQFRPLLWQVTAFTAAHTVTLALGATGILTIPASVVEPLIAATIVFVGVENVLGWGTTRSRTALVFCFGLLHGLGFASVLGDFGIASGRFVQALLGFNVGVEFGQLFVIGVAFALVGVWFARKSWYRRAIAVPVSAVISLIGLYWVIERTGVIELPPLPLL
ncbi:HupE/UreJ family protein [Rhodobacterales bacterium HKCCE2091]|nr:HupE/UreJ family protein [Rhodobacterales bacterium HKCCE2091]